MFDVKAEEGVVAGTVDGVHMDAAVHGGMAGLEVSLERFHAFDEHRGTRHSRLQLTLDMRPEVMQQLAMLLCVKLDWPAFTPSEWRRIADTLTQVGMTRNDSRDLVGIAERIAAAPKYA